MLLKFWKFVLIIKNKNMNICLINFDAIWKDKQKNIEKKEELIKRALELNSKTQLIVFPELSLTGYILDEDSIKLAETEF
jgi:predicted amidohydrolase